MAGRPHADLQARAAGVALWPAVLSSFCPLQEAELDREEAPSPPFSLAAPCKGSQLWPCDSVCKRTVSSRSRNPGKCLSLLCPRPRSSDCLCTSSASGPGRRALPGGRQSRLWVSCSAAPESGSLPLLFQSILPGLSWMPVKNLSPCRGPSSWDGSSSQNIIAES